MSKPVTTPANIPADAIGFVSTRTDKPGRLAIFRPDGALANTYGFDMADVVEALAVGGFTMDAEGIVRGAR